MKMLENVLSLQIVSLQFTENKIYGCVMAELVTIAVLDVLTLPEPSDPCKPV